MTSKQTPMAVSNKAAPARRRAHPALVAAVMAAALLPLRALAASYAEGFQAYQAQDYATAFDQWQQAAVQGDANAAYGMAILYNRGLGVAPDAAVAMRWYGYAAEIGSPEARRFVAGLAPNRSYNPADDQRLQDALAVGATSSVPVDPASTPLTQLNYQPAPQKTRPNEGVFIAGSIGASFLLDGEAQPTNQNGINQIGRDRDVEFETGINLGLEVGYQFSNGLAAYAGYGFRRAEADRLSGGAATATADDLDASVKLHSLIAGLQYEIDTGSAIRPFFGAGAGVAFVDLDLNRLGATNLSVRSGNETVYAVEAFAGVRYEIQPGLSIFVRGKYFETDKAGDEVKVEIGDLTLDGGLRYQF